ncbi:MAG: hypothetical protein ACOYOB_09735 [Myxococcota bacterium]
MPGKTFDDLTRNWPQRERQVLDTLRDPFAIQVFLDETPYSTESIYRSPLSVLRDRRAHCFDGALLAAAALRRMGEPPLILDLRAHDDDDHVLAIFKRDGHFGCIAKSNTSVLRYREPVYRSLRELAMSFFDLYYNLDRKKALREYSWPVDLSVFDRFDWMGSDAGLERIATRLDTIHHERLLTPAMIAGLSLVDEKLYAAGLLGSDAAGLYQPTGKSEAAK